MNDKEVQSEMFRCVSSGSVKTLRSFLTFKKDVPLLMT